MNIRLMIFIVVLMLVGVGIVMVYSSSAVFAYEKYSDGMYFLKRHLVYLLLGFIGAIMVMSVNYSIIQKYSRWIFLFCLLLLGSVYIPGLGVKVSGAHRWINICGLSFQPSEFMKLGIIVYFANLISTKYANIKLFFKGLLPLLVVLGLVIGLILLQPDLGTSFAIAAVSFIMFLTAGINMRFLWVIAVGAIPCLYFLIFSVAYRRKRMLAFLDPWADPKGIGFQIIQSFVALGCGGLFGVGLGQSRQKLFYLPQSHTDFIFSIIGEETGLLGASFVLGLFMTLTILGFMVALKAKDRFGRFVAIGITSLIGLEAFINIAVCTGMIPTKGLPLPFVSFGGTALITHIVAIGLLLNISKNRLYENKVEF